MKRILLFSIIIILITSCGNMLDIYPHSAISPDAVTENDLGALEAGMYNKCQNMPRESFILNDLMGGLVKGVTHASAQDLINHITQIDNDVVQKTWNGYFTTLSQVNNVLSITLSRAENADVNRVKGSAYFFRAYIYLNLVTHWGDVPMLEKSTFDNVPRDPADKIWEFIESDLDKAEEYLPAFTETGSYYYLSKDAAKALKARVALYRGDKQKAAEIAESFIRQGQFKIDKFEKIFRKEPNSEIIFAFENLTEESNVAMSALFYNYSHPNKGSYFYRPTINVTVLFNDKDNRKNISWDSFGGQACFNKYPSGQTGTDPVILIRMSEMYLISAEARGLEGINRLNELRNQRGLEDLSPIPNSEDEYMEALLEERTREFLTEGHRYYDFVRTGHGADIGLQDYQKLLPVPESQRLVNTKLSQNPGY